jgi:hypothetical protein
VALQRPLRLFGRSFQVHISSSLTFSPVTVLEAAFGQSWLQLLRQDKRRPDVAMRDLWRGVTRRNRLSKTTRDKVKRFLREFFPPETLQPLLIGEMPAHVPPVGTDWEILRQTIGPPGEDVSYRIMAEFARFDGIARAARDHLEHERTADVFQLVGGLIDDVKESWSNINPEIDVRVALLIDVSLKVWAYVENRRKSRRVASRVRASDLLALLQHGRMPIGHWLRDIQNSVGRRDLRDLSGLMAGKGIKRHKHLVSHDLLKKWSSGRQLMPPEGRDCVLNGVGKRVDFNHEWQRSALARWASFLCDLVIAGTRGDPPSWSAAQEQIRRRYTALSAARLNMTNLEKPPTA